MNSLYALPPLWATESTETQDIILATRFTCAWHAMAWYPVEFDEKLQVAYGLTVRAVPEWRHFHASELSIAHGGVPVVHDQRFVGGRVPLVPDIRRHHLDDITPFYPSPLPDLGLG